MSTDLIAKIRERPHSERHWASWYKSVYPKLYYAAFRFANGNAEDASDLVQETFARFLNYGSIEEVTSEQHARAYLITICRNLAINRSARPRETSLEGLEEFEGIATPDSTIDSSIDFDRMLRALEPGDRQIMLWARDGESVSEIARKLGVSYTAAGVRLHRIRKRLQKAFSGV